MSQQLRLGRGNTTVSADEKGSIVIRFHWTDIVTFNTKRIVLNSNGWRTATTKTRMNQASNQFNLGYSVSQKDGAWFVSFREKTIGFTDGMILKR